MQKHNTCIRRHITRIAVFLLTFVIAASSLTPCSSAANSKLEQDSELVTLYSADAITDMEAIMARAQNNVDDLQARRGIALDCNVDTSFDCKYNVGYTTQLVSVYEVDGHTCEDYVVSAVAYPANNYFWNSDSGYRLVVSVWYTWYDNVNYKYKFHNSNSYYTIDGNVTSLPQRLLIGNKAFTGYLTNRSYTNAQGFAYPVANNTYSVPSGTSEMLYNETGSYIHADAILTLENGKQITVEVDGAGGYNYPSY